MWIFIDATARSETQLLQELGIKRVLPEPIGHVIQTTPGFRKKLESQARVVHPRGVKYLLCLLLLHGARFHRDSLLRSFVNQIHLLAQTLFSSTRRPKRFQSIRLSREGLVDVALEFLLLVDEAAKLILSHFHVASLVATGAFIAATRANVYLAHAVVFYTGAAFFDHGVSEVVDDFGKFEATLSAVALNTKRRHHGKP